MARYLELKDVYDRTGRLRLADGSPLLRWRTKQLARLKAGRLDDEQVTLLADIGIRAQGVAETAWRDAYGLLEQFYRREAHLDVPSELLIPNRTTTLRKWMTTQAFRSRAGTLDDWMITLLDQIGFSWTGRAVKEANRWEEHFNEFAAFQRAHGHINMPGTGTSHPWISVQRAAFANGTLRPDRQTKLASVDPDWHDLRKSLTSARTRRYFQLTDASWHDIRPLLPMFASKVWENADHRAVIESLVWKLHTGAAWTDLNLPGITESRARSWHKKWISTGIWPKIETLAVLRGAPAPPPATTSADLTGHAEAPAANAPRTQT
jgi:hypothetical protein